MPGELILVVEDNEKNRKLVSDVLGYAGYIVVEASTAAEGIAMARGRGPDLILLDIGLPDQDGLHTLRELRQDSLTAGIPVVAVTALAMAGDRDRLLRAGFDGYLSKPIDVKEFANQVSVYLGTRPAEPSDADLRPKLLVVDDTPANVRLLEAILVPSGYLVIPASSGAEALELVARERPHLVLLDIEMPEMDGYEVCRTLRADPETATLPVIMVTSSVGAERLRALENGADDFVFKPFNKAELLARVRSLVKVKEFQNQLEAQAKELADLNRTLQARVASQVDEVEQLQRLQRFLSPQVADVILNEGHSGALAIHRREIAIMFCDLRGFTAFAGSVEPEEAVVALREYHEEIGRLVREFEATVGHFAGDGVMVFFNDPIPCPDPATKAVGMALAVSESMAVVTERWRRQGHLLGFGIGISYGFATLGEMGFEGRRDYAAVGSAVNLASRLCDEAAEGQILIGQRAFAEVEDLIEAVPIPDLTLKGFSAPVAAWRVVGWKP